MKRKSFQDWCNGFNGVFEDMLLKWKNAREKGDQEIIKVPKGFHEFILSLYMAYITEMHTRRLVMATWVLAISTIILSVIILYLQYIK